MVLEMMTIWCILCCVCGAPRYDCVSEPGESANGNTPPIEPNCSVTQPRIYIYIYMRMKFTNSTTLDSVWYGGGVLDRVLLICAHRFIIIVVIVTMIIVVMMVITITNWRRAHHTTQHIYIYKLKNPASMRHDLDLRSHKHDLFQRTTTFDYNNCVVVVVFCRV